MEIPHLNPAENSLKQNKSQDYPQKANENGLPSFWAFLTSIFIYISIIYIFKLSPSSLLNTTKFWFFIFNTLILIIAADFGAFSSSRKQTDLCEEIMKNSRANSFPSFESHYQEIVKKRIPKQKVENSQEIQEKDKEVVVVHKSGFSESKLKNVDKNEIEKFDDTKQENKPDFIPKVDNDAHEEKKGDGSWVRSMSNKAVPVINTENKIILCSSEPEKQEKNEEDDEYSTMSNEDLNRRVEEFIQRFNKQIQLRAAQSRICQNLVSSPNIEK